MFSPQSARQKHDLLAGFDVSNIRGSKAATLLILTIAVACVTVMQQRPSAQIRASAQGALRAERATGMLGQKPAEPAKPTTPKVLFAKSPDGTRIAYEVAGSGPALMLVHGGGQTRRTWSERGYVERLSGRFTVIALDRRGSGDSDKPARADAYALDRVLEDMIAVADAAGAKRFHLWGFGHGATIGRYLAARSDRVIASVLVAAAMGPPVTGIVKSALEGLRAKWQPMLEAQQNGTLDLKKLSAGDKAAWDGGIAISAISLGALLDYPPLEPAEIKAPSLWVVGSEDETAMANVKEYEGKLSGTKVTLATLSGATYSDSFAKIEPALAVVEPFLAGKS